MSFSERRRTAELNENSSPYIFVFEFGFFDKMRIFDFIFYFTQNKTEAKKTHLVKKAEFKTAITKLRICIRK
jgi:hypothetical protein